MFIPSVSIRSAAAVLLLIAAACGGDGPVEVPAVATVEVSAVTERLVPGGTHTLTATLRDDKGNVLTGMTVAWRSSNDAVASVSAGLVTAVSTGTAKITASSGGREANVDVTVIPGGLVGTGGGRVTADSGAVTMTFPAGAVPANTKITVAPAPDSTGNEHAIAGTSYEFGPDGTQFSQPVTLELKYKPETIPAGTPIAALRIAKLVAGKWQLLTENVVVDSASGKVRASIRSFSRYGIVADACVNGTLNVGTVRRGKISKNDCLFTVAGRRSDYYALSAPAGSMIAIETSGPLVGLVGIKQATSDPTVGRVWHSATIAKPLQLVSNGSALQLYVSGWDSTQYGDYSITLRSATPSHTCGVVTALMPGVSFSSRLDAPPNSCEATVKFHPIPGAIGNPLWTHNYYVKLEAGKTYTIRLGEFHAASSLSLAVFAGEKLLALEAQRNDFNDCEATSRTVTVTATATGYHAIEIGSGMFSRCVGNRFNQWIRWTSSYTLSVSP